MSDQWLSIVEYARAHSISDMTVRRRIKNGKLHAVLKDGKYFIPEGSQRGTRYAPEPARPVPQSSPVLSPPAPSRTGGQATPAGLEPGWRSDIIPKAVSDSVARSEKVMANSTVLLSFCESAIRRIEKSTDDIEQKYQARLEAYESALRAKDAELQNLRQQVEDLQLLVKIFERRTP